MEHGNDAEKGGAQGPDDGERRALEGALGPLFEGAQPPLELKGRLRREAEARFAPGRPRPRLRPRLLPRFAAAAAAACAAAGLAAFLALGRGGGGPSDTAVAERSGGAASSGAAAQDAADVDASGEIDIFDAYLVARAVGDGDDMGGLPDLDGDGLVTGLDADLIAARAVELPR